MAGVKKRKAQSDGCEKVTEGAGPSPDLTDYQGLRGRLDPPTKQHSLGGRGVHAMAGVATELPGKQQQSKSGTRGLERARSGASTDLTMGNGSDDDGLEGRGEREVAARGDSNDGARANEPGSGGDEEGMGGGGAAGGAGGASQTKKRRKRKNGRKKTARNPGHSGTNKPCRDNERRQQGKP